MTEVTPIGQAAPLGLALAVREEIPGAADVDPDVIEAIAARAAAAHGAQPPADKKWHQRLGARITGRSVTSVGFSLLLVGIQGVVQAESWRGLTGFGRLIHITGAAVQGVPITLDGVSTLAALLALKAELDDESSYRERLALYGFTLASCAANYWHGMHSGGVGEALYFGGMSLAVAIVFDFVLRQIRLRGRRVKGRRGKPVPQFSLQQWLVDPGLTFLAKRLAIKHGIETTDAALDAARAERKARADARQQAEEDAQYKDLPALAIDAAVLSGMSARDRLAVAFGATGDTNVPAALAMLRKHDAGIDSSHAYKLRAELLEGAQS